MCIITTQNKVVVFSRAGFKFFLKEGVAREDCFGLAF